MGIVGVVVVSLLLAAAVRGDPAEAAGGDAATLLVRTRDAPATQRFTGQVRIGWRVGKAFHQATVDVRDDQGTVEAVDGSHTVVGRDNLMFLRSGGSWTAFDVPAPTRVPEPGGKWALSSTAGPSIVGRPTTVVRVRRDDGSTAEALFVDPATGLLLGRDVLAADGTIERSYRFVSLTLGTPAVALPAASGTRDADVASVPSGYLAPSRVGSWQLASRVRHGDGVLLTYADGVFLVSVLEERGDIQWSALPTGGEAATVDGARARRYTAADGAVVVWARDGLVVTCLSDAPTDVLASFATNLASGDSPSGWRRAVDFVLGPFGWG
jgi:hypothetical protein